MRRSNAGLSVLQVGNRDVEEWMTAWMTVCYDTMVASVYVYTIRLIDGLQYSL